MSNFQTIFPGDTVKHKKYGEGTVLKMDPDGIAVRFYEDAEGGETGLEIIVKQQALKLVKSKEQPNPIFELQKIAAEAGREGYCDCCDNADCICLPEDCTCQTCKIHARPQHIAADADAALVKVEAVPPVAMRDLICKLYEAIGNSLGIDPAHFEQVKNFLYNRMSDKEVQQEWKSILNGNVKKVVQMFKQLQQPGQAEQHPEMVEQLQQLHEQIADGFLRTKEAGEEVDPQTFEAVEKMFMAFADDFVTEMNGGKQLKGPKDQELLEGATAVKADGKQVEEWEFVDHGVENSQYFQGCGVSGTEFDECYTGIGGSYKEALNDAAEQMAGSGVALPAEMEQEIEGADDTDLVSEVLHESRPSDDIKFTLIHISNMTGEEIFEEDFESLEDAQEAALTRIKQLEEKQHMEVEELTPGRQWEITEPEDAGMIPEESGILAIKTNESEVSEQQEKWESDSVESELHYFASIRVKFAKGAEAAAEPAAAAPAQVPAVSDAPAVPVTEASALAQVVAKQWSSGVKTKWHPKEGFFSQSAEKIAEGLKRESDDLKQAMGRLTFYINRAGGNLSAEDKTRLENAKTKLHKLYETKSDVEGDDSGESESSVLAAAILADGPKSNHDVNKLFITDEDSAAIGKPWEVKLAWGDPLKQAEHFADKFFGAGQWAWDEVQKKITDKKGNLIELAGDKKGSGESESAVVAAPDPDADPEMLALEDALTALIEKTPEGKCRNYLQNALHAVINAHHECIPGAPAPVQAALDSEMREALLEQLAALEHEQWMEWAKAVKGEVSPERAARWEEAFVPYDQLDRPTQQLDLEWAEEVMELIEPMLDGGSGAGPELEIEEAPPEEGAPETPESEEDEDELPEEIALILEGEPGEDVSEKSPDEMVKEMVTKVVDAALYPNLSQIGASLITAAKKRKAKRAKAGKKVKAKKKPMLHGRRVKAAPTHSVDFPMMQKVDYLHGSTEDYPVLTQLFDEVEGK